MGEIATTNNNLTMKIFKRIMLRQNGLMIILWFTNVSFNIVFAVYLPNDRKFLKYGTVHIYYL